MVQVQFDETFASIMYLNGIPDNAYGEGLLAGSLKETNLDTETLLYVGEQVRTAPAAAFCNLGRFYGVKVDDITTYEAALVAGYAANLKCELIFKPHIMQNIYSSIAVRAVIDELVRLGQEAEIENSFVNVFNVSVDVFLGHFCNLLLKNINMAVLNKGFVDLFLSSGVSNNQYYKNLFGFFSSATGLDVESLLKIGRYAHDNALILFPTGTEYINIPNIEAFEAALIAGNAANLKCERIFASHDLQNIYSSTLAQASVARFLEDTMNLGIEAELESLVADFLNNTIVMGE